MTNRRFSSKFLVAQNLVVAVPRSVHLATMPCQPVYVSVFVVVDIISLEESQGMVNNSPFVNAIVKQSLLTPSYIYSLHNKTTTDFHFFANNIKVALDDKVYHPAYDGFHLSK